MELIRHDLRLSETVTPFGVGAILDIRGESLVAPDTSWWDKKFAPQISCRRLVNRIGAGELRQAPAHAGKAGKDTPSLVYWRFPAWRFCERCGKVTKLTGKSKGKWLNACECGGFLVPMRYVAVCQGGSHMQDIPWFSWTHRGRGKELTDEVRFCKSYASLRLVRSANAGEGLRSLSVRCDGCGHSRSLADLVAEGSLSRDGIRCNGTQPWSDDIVRPGCDHPLVAVQRGATGNYIAERLSALDIPEGTPESEQNAERIRAHVYFEKVVADNGGPQAEVVAGWIADELNVSAEEVLALAASNGEAQETSPILDLKDGEWAAFVQKLGAGRDRSGSDFVVDGWQVLPGDEDPISLTERLVGIGQVQRVRAVTALLGFRRHSAEADFVAADIGPDRRRNPVFPAIEVFGEGIFLRFDEERLREWERLPEVRSRAEILIRRRNSSEWARRLDDPEPRFLALHTLSHLLMRQLAFESGYASASLQERIYASSDRTNPTAGILIYTAAGDSQGTLGGLVRLGRPRAVLRLVIAALDEADVCSNDPVCIESDRQGSSSLNLSACHGCSLVSETSCESGNRLLDRQLILGGSSVPGFLGGVLSEARSV